MLPIPIPIHGTAADLFALSRTAKRDIQGYILGQYKAQDGKQYQSTDPAETRIVFFLRLGEVETNATELIEEARSHLETYIHNEDSDVCYKPVFIPEEARVEELADDEQPCMAEYEEEDSANLSTIEEECESQLTDASPETSATTDSTSQHEAKRKARRGRNKAEPSFAHVMSMARLEDFPFSTLSDSDNGSSSESVQEDSGISADVACELRDNAIPNPDEHMNLDTEKDDNRTVEPDSNDDLPVIQTHNHSDTAPFEFRPLQRHDGAVTLAALIARAEAVDKSAKSLSSIFSSSASSSSSLPPCHDPHFSGHTICLGRDRLTPGLSLDDAFRVLQERFEFEHEIMGGSAMLKAWQKKNKMRAELVFRRSWLSVEISSSGDDKDEDDIEVMSSPLPMIAYDDRDDHTLNSSFDEDIDESRERLDASGNFGSDDGVLEEPSSLFDENVGEYDDYIVSPRTSRDDIHLEVPNVVSKLPQASSSTLDLNYDGISGTSLHNVSSKDDLEIHYGTPSLHNTSSTDTLHKPFPVRRLFSNGYSAQASESSTSSVRPANSRLIDALDLEIDKHKCKDGCTICVNALRGFSIATIGQANTAAGRSNTVIGSEEKRVVSLPAISIFSDLKKEEKVEKEPASLDAEENDEQVGNTTVHRRVVSLPVVPPVVKEDDDDETESLPPLNSELDGEILDYSPPRLPHRQRPSVPDTPDRIGTSIDNFLTYMGTTTNLGSSNLPFEDPDRSSIDLLFTLRVVEAAIAKTSAQGEQKVHVDGSGDYVYAKLLDAIPHSSRRRRWAAKVKQKAQRCVQGAKDLAVGAGRAMMGGIAGHFPRC